MLHLSEIHLLALQNNWLRQSSVALLQVEARVAMLGGATAQDLHRKACAGAG